MQLNYQNSHNTKSTIIVLLLILFTINISAQSNKNTCVSKDWQFNYNLGFTEFYGDASTNGYFKKFSGEIAFATGVTARKYIKPAIGIGVNLWYSGIKSNKSEHSSGVPTSFSLTGNYFDGNVNLLVDFNTLFWGVSERKLSVYGIVGVGYSTWSTTLTNELTGQIINNGDTIGDGYYKKGAFVFPVGLGLNYMLSKSWALNFEMNLRTIINDDVDLWRDGFKYDQLLYTSVGVSYFINRNGHKKRSVRNLRGGVPIKSVSTYDYQVRNNQTQKISSSTSPSVILIETPVEKKVIIPSEIIYKVQIFATRNKMPSFKYLREKYNIVGDIYENYQNGIYRYSTGSYNNYHEAINHVYIMKNKGVADAFVAAYKYDIRISITPEMKK